ncbi:hypothetical protein T01_5552 [Trichinella spiralis]|uniref:Uncharacterized protein n=1 Tax=Trichinella spiralis TaxID=6334 RepID=A0A0V1BE16_TRISP|nr:hypothetical protein T01_5552 [Trichinella spiralis]
MELEPPRTQCVPTPEISTVKLGLKTQREGYFPKYAHHPSLNVYLMETTVYDRQVVSETRL